MLILGSCKAKDPRPGPGILLHFNGDDEAITTVDSSTNNHTITRNGDVELDTAHKQFGTASSYHAAYGDYWSVASHASLGIDGVFTLEAWVRIPSVIEGVSHVIRMHTGSYAFYLQLNDGAIGFNDEYGYIQAGEGTIISVDTWTHLAVSRDISGDIRGFLNGAVQWTQSHSSSMGAAGNSMQIGSASVDYPFAGHIDEVRFYASCEYPTSFTPPTVEF